MAFIYLWILTVFTICNNVAIINFPGVLYRSIEKFVERLNYGINKS